MVKGFLVRETDFVWCNSSLDVGHIRVDVVRTVLTLAEETHLVHDASNQPWHLDEIRIALAGRAHLLVSELRTLEPRVDAACAENGLATAAHARLINDLGANLACEVVCRVLSCTGGSQKCLRFVIIDVFTFLSDDFDFHLRIGTAFQLFLENGQVDDVVR